jgi:hypothetical protein
MFTIKELDNVTFSFQELLDYYAIIKEQHQDLKWVPNFESQFTGHAWAIHTKLADITIPCAPLHLPPEWVPPSPTDNNQFDTPTKLLFGFAEKCINAFPCARQASITVHNPGSIIDAHIDKEIYCDEEYFKIHIPITGNDQSYFIFDNERFVLTPGKIYLVNTSLMHSTNNLGSTDRAHLIFKVPVSKVPEILATNISF